MPGSRWLGLLLVPLLGCSSKPAPTNQIQGQVFFQGQPLRGGLVVFVPDAEQGNRGSLVSAKIGDDGRFQIDPTEAEPIRPGSHRVAVAATSRETTPSQYVSLFREVPSRYRNPQQSGLSCEIKPGRNRVDIYLEDY
jgi:hypothetical protein